MEPRITTSELAYYVQRQFGVEPYDFAFEFLQRWLRADPAIFLHENKIMKEDFETRTKKDRRNSGLEALDKKVCRLDLKPDLFLTVDTPDGQQVRHEPGAMEAQEWILNRQRTYNLLRIAEETTDNLGRIYDEKFKECLGLFEYPRGELDLLTWDHDVYPLVADVLQKTDLTLNQWKVFHRITMTQALAIRYCLEVLGEIPVKVQRDFKRKYAVKKKPGKQAGVPATKRVCVECLKTLIRVGIHEPYDRGTNEAATQINEIWNLCPDDNSVSVNIRIEYSAILRKSRENIQ